ncbi:MAG: DUF692 domain-containing protein [Hyphomicrobiaceae bacterium]|nr:DUF692 domain-containing protein [Hyphomicrobiaceae bacterium]
MTHLPARAGVGFKPEHFTAIVTEPLPVGWFEVHAENYMGAGGPPHRMLDALRALAPISVHGVGLSIGAGRGLDPRHLARLKAVVDRFQPAMVSEHLAWSSHGDTYLNDLLPVPYDGATLARVVEHIDTVQSTLGRPMLLENPSTYVAFAGSTWDEVDFIAEVARRTGCGLLLDVNNVWVSSINQQRDPIDYLARFPVDKVGEIHLAGHAPDTDDDGRPLLIDAHDRAVADVVWDLYARAIASTGPVATLIEWDNDIPAWPVLAVEAAKAEAVMALARRGAAHAA